MENQIGLFNTESEKSQPLAYRVRPNELELYFGQPQIKAKLDNLDLENLPHLIFFGPPGCGKTTLAHILANKVNYQLYEFNAVLGGVNDLRKVIKEADADKESTGKKSIIFIDEIHRFNKGQQDALLPYLERGDFVLFGATTENPNTSLNKAILSRVQKWRLEHLKEIELEELLLSVTKSENKNIAAELLKFIAKHSNGDARSALNQLEVLFQNEKKA